MAASQPTLFDVEIWKDIPGYEGYYEASTRGRVRSLDRIVNSSNGQTRISRGKVLTQSVLGPGGYLRVTLSKEGIAKTRTVHRLVMETFIGPHPDGMEICHNNGDPADNRLENLRFGTPSDNRNDAVKHGTHYNTKKTHCPRGHVLVAPNLVACAAKAGRRECLSCARANTRIYKNPHLMGKKKEIGDSYYRAIMKRVS